MARAGWEIRRRTAAVLANWDAVLVRDAGVPPGMTIRPDARGDTLPASPSAGRPGDFLRGDAHTQPTDRFWDAVGVWMWHR
jgi:hypothetical protein